MTYIDFSKTTKLILLDSLLQENLRDMEETSSWDGTEDDAKGNAGKRT